MSQGAVNAAIIIGAILVAVGISFMFWPAGLVVIGLELILAAMFLVEVER